MISAAAAQPLQVGDLITAIAIDLSDAAEPEMLDQVVVFGRLGVSVVGLRLRRCATSAAS